MQTHFQVAWTGQERIRSGAINAIGCSILAGWADVQMVLVK